MARASRRPAAATAHRLLGWAEGRLGDDEQANTHLYYALHLDTEAADLVGQGYTRIILGLLGDLRDRPDQALDHAQQALTLFQAAGHHRGQAAALNNGGWCHARFGYPNKALTYCQQALTLFEQIGDRWGEAAAWDSLGYAHHQLHHHARAVDCYQNALTLFRELRDHYNEATTLINIGNTHRTAEHPRGANTAWTAALEVFTRISHPDAEIVRAKLATLDHNPPTQPVIDPSPA